MPMPKNDTKDPQTLEPVIEGNETYGEDFYIGEEEQEKEVEYYDIPARVIGVKNNTDKVTIESILNAKHELGVIELCWPHITEPEFENRIGFPESYYTNHTKERLLLAYAENFRRQYHFHYPERRPLLMQAPNECGIQKMVCTTIRPTKLCYAGTTSWKGCASLVADFCHYEPLKRPMVMPERILSPFTVLRRRCGNAFELATLLVSYLCGADYKAYVVFGYANRDTTLNIRFRTECPEIPENEREPYADYLLREAFEEQEAADRLANMPIIGEYEDWEGDFIEPGLEMEGEMEMIGEEEIEGELESKAESDEWVIKKKESIKSLREESTISEMSGEGHDKYFRDYKGYEGLDEIAGISDKFQLEEEEKSEEEEKEEGLREEGIEEEDVVEKPRYYLMEMPDLRSHHILKAMAKLEERKQNKYQKKIDRLKAKITEIEAPPHDEMDGWRVHAWVLVMPSKDADEPFFIEPSQGFRYPLDAPQYYSIDAVYNHENYYINLQDCTVGLGNLNYEVYNLMFWEHMLPGEPYHFRRMVGVDDTDPTTSVETEKHLDMPKSWVEALEISVQEFVKRYPGHYKYVHYKRALLENFSPHSQRDGLVTKVRLFKDYKMTRPYKTFEWYENRVDMMETATLDYLTEEILETFKRGRDSTMLKSHKYKMDSVSTSIETYRTFEFYYYPRIDHLEKIVLTPLTFDEYYVDREDRLQVRKVVYSRGEQQAGRQLYSICEIYNRNPNIPPKEDVLVRTYLFQENAIELRYQYADNFITNSTRRFIKPNLAETAGRILYDPNTVSCYIADLNETYPRPLELYYSLCDNMELESLIRKHIRDYQSDMVTLLKLRHAELTEPLLEVDLYDTSRNSKAQEGLRELETEQQKKVEREVEPELDPLAPYIARLLGKLENMQPLAVKEAMLVREQCINDFINRYVARQQIVQERFEKSNNEYKEKKLWYLANQYVLTPEKEAVYFRESAELAFKVHVLEVRLIRHRDHSNARYTSLINILDHHPLLSIYNQNKMYYDRERHVNTQLFGSIQKQMQITQPPGDY